jgi:hypothetical protein
MKGIITIAVKHSLYGRYAYNLAVSLRATNPIIPISIIADEIGISHLNESQRAIFDHIITPSLSDYSNGEKITPLNLKYHLYKYSPYENTIFMDADTILTPTANVGGMFESLQGINFTIANRGEQTPQEGVSQWVMGKNLDVPYWYDLSSEFIYFEKGVVAKNVFSDALKHYKQGVLPTKAFAGDKPDEPFLMLGMIDNGIKPHKVPFKPSFWYAAEKHKSAVQIKQEYTMFSLGGKLIPRAQKLIYDDICKNVSYRSGLATMSIHQKMNSMNERKVI